MEEGLKELRDRTFTPQREEQSPHWPSPTQLQHCHPRCAL